MAAWEDKLGAILNDPQTMEQILSIAQSLDGGKSAPEPTEQVQTPEPPDEGAGEADLGGLNVDPRVMAAGMQALSAWQGPDDSRTALLQSLRPFIRPERHGKLDKAVRITKLSKVVRAALDTLKGGGDDV